MLKLNLILGKTVFQKFIFMMVFTIRLECSFREEKEYIYIGTYK